MFDSIKLLRAENEKLIQDSESKKAEYNKVSESLQKEIKKSERYRKEIKSLTKHYEEEIKSLTAKVSEETDLALTLGEENKKLQTSLDKVSKEKRKLIGQLTRSTGTTDLIEEQIENGFHNLTDLFLKEMSELRNQFQNSVHSTRTILPSNSILAQQPSQNGCSNTQEQTTITEADTELPPTAEHNQCFHSR